MPVKRIVVLANSVKHDPGRCVAGRELLPDGTLGAWVRPVSQVGEGQLYAQHMRMADGAPLNVLDVVDVPVLAHCGDPLQPENWHVNEQVPWQRRGAWTPADVASCYENPRDLWLDGAVRSDRIRVQHAATLQPVTSICVVQLGHPQVAPDRYDQHRDRVSFHYGGTHYALKLTDPAYSRNMQGQVPSAACISLAPPFNGHHYKLVATLFW